MPGYAEDRARIEDLMARYLFALDWQDVDAYAATFAEDGVLDWAMGIVTGRAAIAREAAAMAAAVAARAALDAPLRPARRRHFVTNLALAIDGDRATARAYWCELNNDVRDRWPYVAGYGHYEDDLVRDGDGWLFARRRICNEILAHRAAGADNPVGWGASA
ncbi:MAG: nuclear transport factor 2 family protein [Sphingomonas fennica]